MSLYHEVMEALTPLIEAFERLGITYYVDEQAWQAAVRRGLPYNIIHLGTMLKVDLMPLKRRAFSREEARRAQPHLLEAGTHPVRVASAEDAILTKLEWFELGGRSSGRQWQDLLGILKQQGAALDGAYLAQWADVLGVRDLLEQALVEAGFKGPCPLKPWGNAGGGKLVFSFGEDSQSNEWIASSFSFSTRKGFSEPQDEEETPAWGAKPTRPPAFATPATRAAAPQGCLPSQERWTTTLRPLAQLGAPVDQHEAAGGDKQKTLKEVSREGKISPLRSRLRVPRWLKRERDRQEEREMSWAKRPVQWMSNQQGDAPGNSGQTGPRQQSTSQADPLSNLLYSNAYSNADAFQRDSTLGSEQWVKESSHRRTPVNRGEQARPNPVCAICKRQGSICPCLFAMLDIVCYS